VKWACKAGFFLFVGVVLLFLGQITYMQIEVAGTNLRVGQIAYMQYSTPTPVTFYLNAIADTTLSSAQPEHNYGRETSLTVRASPSETQVVLVQFDLTTLPVTATLRYAVLRLHLQTATGPELIRVTAVQAVGDWREDQVTWATRPATGAYTATVAVGTAPGERGWSVTGLVRAWQEGTLPNHGLLVYLDDPDGSRTFGSRESDTPPQLEVSLRLPTPTPTPTLTRSTTPTRTPTLTSTRAGASPTRTPSPTSPRPPSVTPPPTATPLPASPTPRPPLAPTSSPTLTPEPTPPAPSQTPTPLPDSPTPTSQPVTPSPTATPRFLITIVRPTIVPTATSTAVHLNTSTPTISPTLPPTPSGQHPQGIATVPSEATGVATMTPATSTPSSNDRPFCLPGSWGLALVALILVIIGWRWFFPR